MKGWHVDAIAIVAIHVGACIAARAAGFDHVSDDDFARVTIAQAFAHAPRLDPSGTSWLPFPFWALGAVMLVAGRALETAQAIAISLNSLALVAPYLALRFVGVGRARALVGIALGYLTPSAIWLGAATVPESFTTSFVAAGAVLLGMGPRRGRASVVAALLVLAATLSRYEAWPVAAVLAVALVVRRRRDLALAAICAAGPLLWMAWNAHAHDGPLHFFRRVASFKRAIGEGATDPITALLLYPRLLFTARPEITVPAMILLVLRRGRRWLVPLVCVGAQVAFLAYGNARDGAPAHHPERALLACFVILALFVADEGLGMLERWSRRPGALVIACVAVLWSATTLRDAADIPGRALWEDRSAQRERGRALRELGAEHITITPCAFESFALVAELAAPENVTTLPRTNAPVTAACPSVTVE